MFEKTCKLAQKIKADTGIAGAKGCKPDRKDSARLIGAQDIAKAATVKPAEMKW